MPVLQDHASCNCLLVSNVKEIVAKHLKHSRQLIKAVRNIIKIDECMGAETSYKEYKQTEHFWLCK